jgi:amino acid permease
MAKRTAADDISDVRFAALTSVIIIASYIVAMTVSSLEAVLAYVGSTGSTSISFILPGLFYYKISDPNSPHHQRLMKDDDYDSLDSNGDDSDDDGVDSEEHAPLTASLASLRGSVRRGARRARRGVSVPKGLLRKLSLALSVYGILVMVVCLATNAFFLPKRH